MTRACHELISKMLGLKGLQKPFPKEAESISCWKSKTCRWKTPWFMTRSKKIRVSIRHAEGGAVLGAGAAAVVEAGGRNVRVPQPLLDLAQIGTPVQRVRG